MEREKVAAEARHWVCIARVCNNHCAFCLDSDGQDGTFVPRAEVEAELQRGRSEGATRLILSGGEATIHPDFLELITLGKRLGYAHVQTITNGRMFAYPDFARGTVSAGLDEVTFSLHGHEADLHDGLTGVPGSFAQTVSGIRNAVRATGLIVSGDVVINRINVPHLRRIMRLFLALGVREIDLLMVMPFGRATPPAESRLLFDARRALPHLRRALELAREPGITVWTNRLDPRLLEGFEGLIQDPHKLHDEVRGRAALFDGLLDGGVMRCAGERCPHCFIRPLCDALRDAVTQLVEGVPGILAVDLVTSPPRGAAEALLARPRRVLQVTAADVSQLETLSTLDRAAELWLRLEDHRWLRPTLRASGVGEPARLLPRGPRPLRDALRLAPPVVVATVDRATAPLLGSLRVAEKTRLLLASPGAGTLGEALDRHVDLRGALGGMPAHGWLDVPPCLSGGRGVDYADPFPLSAVRDDGRLDLHAFVDHFVRRIYRVRSLRCERCAFSGTCRGIGIQRARAEGLGQLRPVER